MTRLADTMATASDLARMYNVPIGTVYRWTDCEFIALPLDWTGRP